MFNTVEELKKFNKKSIDVKDIPLNDLYEPVSMINNKINSIDKVNKKSFMSMECLLKREIKERNSEIFTLRKQLNTIKSEQKDILNKLLLVLDQIDTIEKFALQSNNKALINNLDTVLNILEKELKECGVEEILSIGEIFNNEIHECINTIQDNSKQQYEIVDVIKKGYKFKGKVIRTASVVVVE